MEPQLHPMLVYFQHEHLPPKMKDASKLFDDLALAMAKADVASADRLTHSLHLLQAAREIFLNTIMKLNP